MNLAIKVFVGFLVLSGFIIAMIEVKGRKTESQPFVTAPQQVNTSKDKKLETSDLIYVAKNIDDAKSKSKELKKDILVIFGADWCGYCHKLKDETLTDGGVKVMMTQFIVLYINIDDEPRLSTELLGRRISVPQYIVMDSDSKIKNKGSGFKPPQEFVAWLAK